jgi:hypothetical protein
MPSWRRTSSITRSVATESTRSPGSVEPAFDLQRRFRTSQHGSGRGISHDRRADHLAQRLSFEKLPDDVVVGQEECPQRLRAEDAHGGSSVGDLLRVGGVERDRFLHQDVMARLAIKAVVERLDKPNRKPRDTALPPKLVVRGTTAPPGSAQK